MFMVVIGFAILMVFFLQNVAVAKKILYKSTLQTS